MDISTMTYCPLVFSSVNIDLYIIGYKQKVYKPYIPIYSMLEQQKTSEQANTKQSDSHNKYYSIVLCYSQLKQLTKQANKQDKVIILLTKLKQHKNDLQLNLTYQEIERQEQISKEEQKRKSKSNKRRISV
jgi:hypothetical protein